MRIVRTPQRITLFTRPLCSWCQDAKAWLEERGWNYTTRDVGVDEQARAEAVALSGQPLVPVIEVDGAVLGDFDVGQLEMFLRDRGYLE